MPRYTRRGHSERNSAAGPRSATDVWQNRGDEPRPEGGRTPSIVRPGLATPCNRRGCSDAAVLPMTAIAALFILIWSTGFIIAKAVAPVADPNLFLAVRFALAGSLFLVVAVAARVPWPRRREIPKHLLAGMLLQGGYLGGT